MKITLEQLKKLIREAVEENHGYERDYDYEKDENKRLDADAAKEEEASEEYDDEQERGFNQRFPLSEGAIRLIYTNHGILTEERVRELKECGYEMEECGSWEVEGPSIKTHHEPVSKVIILGPDELEEGGESGDRYGDRGNYSPGYGSMEEASLTEGDTSTPADGGSVTGKQAAVAMPNGPGGAPSPSGASVVAEAFNRRAEALLEAWMEEEVEEELHGRQHELDLDDDGEIEASDLSMLRHGLTDKQVGKDRKRG